MGCGFSSMSSMIYHSKKKKKRGIFTSFQAHLLSFSRLHYCWSFLFPFSFVQCASLKLLCLFNVIFSSNHLLSIQSWMQVSLFSQLVWLELPYISNVSGFTYCNSIKVSKSVKLPSNAIGCNCKGTCTDPRTCSCAMLNGSDFPYVHRDGGRWGTYIIKIPKQYLL